MSKSNLPSLFSDVFGTDFFNSNIGFEPFIKRMTEMNLSNSTYPPYNIERFEYRPHREDGSDLTIKETRYRIEVALAGFTLEDIEVTDRTTNGQRILSIASKVKNITDKIERNFIHKGIAKREFNLSFQLEKELVIDQAKMENGLLIITMIQSLKEKKHEIKVIPIVDSRI